MTLLLDAVGTLIHPVEPAGQTYARHLEACTGETVPPERMQSAFQRLFSTNALPDYEGHPSGHAAERAWWRGLVRKILVDAGAYQSLQNEEGTFETYFSTLFDHYAAPSSWQLYPETTEFLEAASQLGPLAVVSNFDDRLTPVLNGLGVGPFFEHIFTSAEARARKPDPAPFDLALDRLNCAPRETFHCGDSFEADYRGASSLGLRAFHLVRPGQTLLDFLDFSRQNPA